MNGYWPTGRDQGLPREALSHFTTRLLFVTLHHFETVVVGYLTLKFS